VGGVVVLCAMVLCGVLHVLCGVDCCGMCCVV
jgi:hypothetical protein